MTETLTIILTLGGLFFAGIAVLISLFLWLRSEANSDRRHITQIQSEDRKDILSLIRAIETEIRDFHQRLYSLEEKGREPKKWDS